MRKSTGSIIDQTDKKLKIRLLILVFMSFSQLLCSQIKFTQSYGFWPRKFIQDEGYFIMGDSITVYGSKRVIILLKTDPKGEVIWRKEMDLNNNLRGIDFLKVDESGFLILGRSDSGTVFIRTDINGDSLWTKTIKSEDTVLPASMIRSHDGGFVITGSVYSLTTKNTEIFLYKINTSAEQVWWKTFGGSGIDDGKDLIRDSDDGFLIACNYNSGFGTGMAFLLKTDAAGDSLWMKNYNPSEQYSSYSNSLIRTMDGGLMILGGWPYTGLIKTNESGDTLWTQTYKFQESFHFESIIQTSDRGYLIGGYIDGDVGGRPGHSQMTVVKLDSSGFLEWDRQYVPDEEDVKYAIDLSETSYGYAILGITNAQGYGKTYLFNVDRMGCLTENPVITGMDYVCKAGSTILRTSVDFKSYNWSTGAVSDTIIINLPGEYSVQAIDSNNCPLLSDTVVIHEKPVPDVKIKPTGPVTICPGDSVMLVGEIVNNDPSKEYTYAWNNHSITNNEIQVQLPGKYTVIAEDNFGCNDSATTEVLLEGPFQDEQFCVVTNDLATGKNLLVWEKTMDVATVAYRIYREAGIGDYQFVDQVDYASFSIYKDTAVNPENRAYLYKITSVDSCGNESLLANSHYHKPIHLSWVSSVNGVNLKWTDYEIENTQLGDYLTSYEIYRGTDSSGLELYTSVGSVNDYTDTDPQTQLNKFYYRVAGVLKNACNPSAGKKEGAYQHSMSNLEDNKFSQGTGLPGNSRLQGLIVYPNPIHDRASIEFLNPNHESYTLIVSDLAGRNVRSVSGIVEERFIISRNGLTSGPYILQLTGPRTYRCMIMIE